MIRPQPSSTLSPYTTLFRSAYAFARTGYHRGLDALRRAGWRGHGPIPVDHEPNQGFLRALLGLAEAADRKSTRLNSSHVAISYAVFCLKKKNKHEER